MSNRKVLAIIPARYASSRFPGKMIAQLGHLPLVQWAYEKAKSTSCISETWIAIDDSRVEDAVKPFMTRTIMTPQSCKNGTERSLYAYKAMRSEFDIIVNIQGDEPLIQIEDIEKVVDCFNNPETQIASLYRKLDKSEDPNDPNIVKVVLNAKNEAMYFSRARIPFDRDSDYTQQDFHAHVGIYAFRASILEQIVESKSNYLEDREMLEQLRWIEGGFTIKMAKTSNKPRGIDTPEQLEALIEDVKLNPALLK